MIQTSDGWIAYFRFIQVLINDKNVRVEAYSIINVFILW